MPELHPCPDDTGQPVILLAPSTPTPLACWDDPEAIARVVPDGPLPERLNGLALVPCYSGEVAPREVPREVAEAIQAQAPCDGGDFLSHALKAPPLTLSPGKRAAAGAVVVETDGRVWVIHPSNAFGGYRATFPKGKQESGQSLEQTAIKETFEEAGLVIALTRWLIDVPRSSTVCRYFLARRLGGSPADMGWESQAVSLVPIAASGKCCTTLTINRCWRPYAMCERPLFSSTLVSRYRGCLLAGACGDALGAPVEFWHRSQIIERFGEPGITDYLKAYGRVGAITDDTQMTLFTAEGLLAAEAQQAVRDIDVHRQVGAAALQRWLITQGGHSELTTSAQSVESALLAEPALHHRRAPGNTCLSALREMTVLGERAVNNSKGCGGVMRMAPVGLFGACHGLEPRETFTLGKALAWLTHGHPSGYLTGGVLAVLVQRLVEGRSLEEGLTLSLALLTDEDDHPETRDALQQAWHLAGTATPYAEAITALGEGWVAEEALAIAVYCALVADDLHHGVVLAVNHDGDSDSTGAIAGNLLGAMHGEDAIPVQWLDKLELREVIAWMGEALYRATHA